MRISDWSSDVCSSDLSRGHGRATCDSPTDAVPQWPPPAHTGDFDGRAYADGVNGALPGRMPCVANPVTLDSYTYPPSGGDVPTRNHSGRSLPALLPTPRRPAHPPPPVLHPRPHR